MNKGRGNCYGFIPAGTRMTTREPYIEDDRPASKRNQRRLERKQQKAKDNNHVEG